jgi:hypothetical protein
MTKRQPQQRELNAYGGTEAGTSPTRTFFGRRG